MNVLIAPDKFKGTLSATQATRAIARGWRNATREARQWRALHHLAVITDHFSTACAKAHAAACLTQLAMQVGEFLPILPLTKSRRVLG